jgi:hypothetical protein
MRPTKVEIEPMWTTKMQQLLCILENPDADPIAINDARTVLLNLATYIDIVNSMQEGIYEQTLSFEQSSSTLH